MHGIRVLTALLAFAGAAHANDKFIDLTPLLPPQANVAVVIDVQAIYNSPLAKKEGWTTRRPLPIPPTLLTAALASRIDPGTFSGGRWEIGVARPKGRLTMDELAVRERGAVETIAGAQAVLSPRNVYFVEFRPWIIGMVSPADRQEVAHWLRDVRNVPGGRVRLEPFLAAAVTSGDRLTQFIMAIDLADAANPSDVVKAYFAGRKAAVQQTAVDAATKVLATLQGAKLTLMVTDTIRGELRFEFGEPPTPLMVDSAKSLLMEYLALRGASLEAIDNWTAEAAGNAIVLRGEIPEKGYRRILSLVAPPAPPTDEQDSGSPVAAEIRMLATLRNFRTIEQFLDDLKRPSQRTQQDFSRFATWYDSFAERIEQLPTYVVDEDVAKFGKATAVRLRGIAASLRGDVLDVQKLEQSISITPFIYATTGWGWRLQPAIWLQSNEAEVRAKQQAAIERGEQARRDLWSRIDNESAAISQALATRYKAPMSGGDK
jgi:hypothetical protein